MQNNQVRTDDGQFLPLMEEFYTLQGEGFHAGKAAYFIRLGGCDIGCSWCDIKRSWDKELYPPVPIDPLIARIVASPAKAVVITGGEPSMYNLGPLTGKLKAKGVETYLETSGSHPLTGVWDWICLSPKQHAQCRGEYHHSANELKVIIETERDLVSAETHARMVNRNCMLFLQPEWSRRHTITPILVDYIRNNPSWRLSIQSHKFIGIP